MENRQLFEIFTERLNAVPFAYFISGSIASIYYGIPRLTHDVDILIDLSAQTIDRFLRLFSAEEFYLPPRETLLEETARAAGSHFNLIDLSSGFKADFYLIGQDPLQRWALDNRKEVKVNDHCFYMAPAEYVIIRKLEYFKAGGSDKHLEDIGNMLAISGDQIDGGFLEKEITSRGLHQIWDGIKKK